jgi:hypothetical protein
VLEHRIHTMRVSQKLTGSNRAASRRAQRSRVQVRRDRWSASRRSNRLGPGGDQSDRCRRKESRSVRRVQLGRVAQSRWRQAAMRYLERRKLLSGTSAYSRR